MSRTKTIQEEQILDHAYDVLKTVVGPDRAYKVMNEVRSCNYLQDRLDFCRAIMQDMHDTVKNGFLCWGRIKREGTKYKWMPVSPREFLCEKNYLGLENEVYPKVLEEFCKMNNGRYHEALLTGSIGSAKSSLAIWGTAYQVYLLSCYRNPHEILGLVPSDEIMFIFQSLNLSHAKSVDYERFKTLIEGSPYFREKFPYDPGITSELRFPNRIIVAPVSGSDKAAIGRNILGGILDELNFMDVTEKSKRTVDQGVYDQAIALYNSIVRRRKSRFMNKGRVPGVFFLVSSKRYPGQFTDKKEAEALKEKKEKGFSTIYIYDKRTWDILPEDRFSGKWFHVFIGDESRKPRILRKGEKWLTSDNSKVMKVPEEYRYDFERDIINALRDIGGVSTLATHPFMSNVEAVTSCFGQVPSILSLDEVDFEVQRLKVLNKRFRNQDMPRYAHIDLALTGDSAGLCIGHVPKFVSVKRADGFVETLPKISLDCILRVIPPKGGEIIFDKIRSILYLVRDLGLDLRWVSLDSYQSRDTIQILRQKGFYCGIVSMDTDLLPYDITKTAFYDGRVEAPEHDHCRRELISLEYDAKKGKVDHPAVAGSSKDCADAVAGVIYGLTMRREIWAMHGISTFDIPASIKEAVSKSEEQVVRQREGL